ncbi:hypothetical protein ACFVHQ_13110 [Actinomycetes bacterium NPDC127524]
MSSIKKKVLNKTMALGLSVAVLTTPFAVLSHNGIAAAATAPTKGSIEYSLLDDDGKTLVKSDKVVFGSLSNLTGDLKAVSNYGYDGVTGDTNNGVALTKSSLVPGKYAVTAKVNGSVTVTSFVEVKASDKATKVKAIAIPSSTDADPKKSGKVSGVVAPNGTVVIKNNTTAWTVKASSTGKFSVYVPAGSYDLVVDTDSGKKNTKYALKVQAGQNNLPFADLEDDLDNNDKLGFEISNDRSGQPTVNSVSKEYKGKAIPNSTVRAYSIDEKATGTTDDVYTMIGETVTKKAPKDSSIGDFSIKLKEVQPGKKIVFLVQDQALNIYTSDITTLPKIDPKFTAMTNALVGKDVIIPFADKSGALLTSKDLKVTLKVGSANAVELNKMIKVDGKMVGDYTIASGKITINNQAIFKNITDFSSDTVIKIGVTSSGFEDSTIDQTVKAVNAPSLTASVAKATNEGVKLTAAATKNTTNKIYYKISAASVDVPKLYSIVSDTTELKSSPKDDITGVDAAINKYLAVYELNAANQVVKFKQITLTTANIKEAAVKSTVTTLTSSDTNVTTTGTVVTVPEGMTAAQLKAVLSVDNGKGSYKIINEALGEAAATDVITEYMTIETTAEDTSKTAKYTIEIK